MGLKISDLYGKMETVEIVDFSQTEKEGKQICVLKVKYGNKQLDLGLFGSETIEKVLDKHGKTTKEGKNTLEIPASKITDEKMIWINQPY